MTAAILALPSAAMAEAIPETDVAEYVNSCIASCSADRDATAQCTEICGCVGTRMSQAWTREDYERYSQAYASDPNDPEVHGQVNGFVQQCASAM